MTALAQGAILQALASSTGRRPGPVRIARSRQSSSAGARPRRARAPPAAAASAGGGQQEPAPPRAEAAGSPFPADSPEAAALREFDRDLAEMEEDLRGVEEQRAKVWQQLADLKAMSAPDWILGLLERAAGWGDRKCEGLRQDVEEKRAERAEVVAALRKARANAGAQADEVQFSLELLKVTTAAVLDDAKADDAKPVGPGMAAFSLVSAKLLSSWLVLWIGSWAGLEGARQLGVPPNWQALPVELMAWTAPYVGLTLLGHAVAPSLMQRPFHGSGPVTEAAERACLQLPAAGIAAVSFAVAYTQVVVWQGLWLQFTLSLLGAPGFSVSEFVDPMGPELYPERLQAAMGGLVHARLPVLLATPLAVAAVGLLEGGWWVSVEISRQLNPAKLPVSIMGKEEDIDVSPSKLLYGVRIGAAGAFLAAEGLATGSLWLPVLTSAAGLGASLLLLQRRHGGAPPPAQT